MKKYKPSKGKLFSFAKKFDGSFLPPCSAVLREKIKRVNYIAALWLNSAEPRMPDILPEQFGWFIDRNNTYKLKWFEGDMTPQSLDVVIDDTSIDDDVEAAEEAETTESGK